MNSFILVGYRYFDPQKPPEERHCRFMMLTLKKTTKGQIIKVGEQDYTLKLDIAASLEELLPEELLMHNRGSGSFFKNLKLNRQDLGDFPSFLKLRKKLSAHIYYLRDLKCYVAPNVYAVEYYFRKYLLKNLCKISVRGKKYLGMFGEKSFTPEELGRLFWNLDSLYPNSYSGSGFDPIRYLQGVSTNHPTSSSIIQAIYAAFIQSVKENARRNSLLMFLPAVESNKAYPVVELKPQQYDKYLAQLLNNQTIVKHMVTARLISGGEKIHNKANVTVQAVCRSIFLNTSFETDYLCTPVSEDEFKQHEEFEDVTEKSCCYLVGKCR